MVRPDDALKAPFISADTTAEGIVERVMNLERVADVTNLLN